MLGLVKNSKAAGRLTALVRSSIGKKLFVGLSGLGLVGFLVGHLAGNLLLFAGKNPEGAYFFDAYAKALSTNPLLIPVEMGLLAMFVMHIGLAIRITLANKAARPTPYAVQASEGGRTLASSTMIISGMIVLAFVIVHLINFKFVDHHDGMFEVVTVHFQNVLWVGFYVACVGVVGLHVSHGLQSAFRTFGLVHPTYTPFVVLASRGLGGLLAVGFASIPIWALITQ